MCFTPAVSFATFLIELVLATFIFYKNPKDKLNKLAALLLILLGLYQLNEFLICKTGMLLFTRLAVAITAFLPAVAVNIALVMTRRKFKHIYAIYIPPVILASILLLSNMYSMSAFCGAFFVRYQNTEVIGVLNGIYYAVYLLIAALMLYNGIAKTKNTKEKKMLKSGLLTLIVLHLATFLFLFLFPSFYPEFPSVYCHFAVLMAILFSIIIWYKEKHKIKY